MEDSDRMELVSDRPSNECESVAGDEYPREGGALTNDSEPLVTSKETNPEYVISRAKKNIANL